MMTCVAAGAERTIVPIVHAPPRTMSVLKESCLQQMRADAPKLVSPVL